MTESNKTIKVKIYFYANGLPDKVGDSQIDTPCWATGVVYVEANKRKKISPQQVTFNGLQELSGAISSAMSAANIVTVTKNV